MLTDQPTTPSRSEIRRFIWEAMGSASPNNIEADARAARELITGETKIPTAEIAAVSAWVKIAAGRALKATALTGMTPIEIVRLSYRYESAASEEEKHKVVADFITERNLSSDLVATLRGVVVAYLNSLAESPQSATRAESAKPMTELKLPPLPEPTTPSTPSPEKRRGGEHTDYSFAVKEEWRRAWAAFIEKHFTPAERANLKVLCLPSPAMAAEISHYIRLGIQPQNITAVEGGDAEARELFLENAKKFGVRPLLGRLEHLLPELEERFDIVNFDFLGPICSQYTHILSHTRVSAKSVIIINLMGARESKETQETLRVIVNSMSEARTDYEKLLGVISTESASRALGTKFVEGVHEMRDLIEEVRESGDSKAVRFFAGDTLLIERLGSCDTAPTEQARTWFKQRGVELTHVQFVNLVVRFVKQNLHNVVSERIAEPFEALGLPTAAGVEAFAKLSAFELVRARPVAMEKEQCLYLSDASNSHTPYYSTFQLFQSPYSVAKNPSRGLNPLILNALLAFGLEEKQGNSCAFNVEVRDPSLGKVPADQPFRRKAEVMLYNNGKLLASMPVGKILSFIENTATSIGLENGLEFAKRDVFGPVERKVLKVSEDRE